jgi:hypothetical protein
MCVVEPQDVKVNESYIIEMKDGKVYHVYCVERFGNRVWFEDDVVRIQINLSTNKTLVWNKDNKSGI